MALTELTANMNIHQSLPDQPALTADELKVEFDKAANLIKEYLNETLLTELNGLITALQNKDTTIETALNSIQTIVNEATTNITSITNTISGLKSGATTKITIGSSVPSSLENGEIYLQYFN